ncbi:MAG: glycoside hydrolase family 43 protein [Lachnospiraceae bacterium]|nr:glycoside hydrolase family 43 protein [Lachnospiraceae bacterium]
MRNYRNPILPGFHPDPSICRVGDTYYLVTSTFEFFPGLPIYKSKNLTDWKCIGHAITRASQVDLIGAGHSAGLYAPTIRYHDGVFFVVCTDVSGAGNFLVYAGNPAGPWSEPVLLSKRGIDPSILFADGTCYLMSNQNEYGNEGIYMCEIDPFTGEQLSEERLLTTGCGGRNAEGPHLYKIVGKYYLMLAEGGTEYGHHETILRSDKPYGPYEPCPHNPILSHADIFGSPISCTGHADLVDDVNGRLWMVALGVRNLPGLFLHNLGRETFLVPVRWENGWPVAGRHGRIDLNMEAQLPGPDEPDATDMDEGWEADLERETEGFFDDLVISAEDSGFREMRSLDMLDMIEERAFTFVRNPDPERYEFDTDDRVIRIFGGEAGLDDWDERHLSPAFAGIRQEEFYSSIETYCELVADDSAEDMRPAAGLSAYYSAEHHMDVYLTRADGQYYVCSRLRLFNMIQERHMPVSAPGMFLRITSDTERYHLYYSEDGREFALLDEGVTAAMCTEITRKMTFTGTFLGLFAENAQGCFTDPRAVFLRDAMG